MDNEPTWKTQLKQELKHAETARRNGNEGMARVCARRAAGIVIEHYLERLGTPFPGPSAYDRLVFLNSLQDTPPEVREVVSHFLIKVNPDHTLPIEADLIAEVRWLEQYLLGGSEPGP